MRVANAEEARNLTRRTGYPVGVSTWALDRIGKAALEGDDNIVLETPEWIIGEVLVRHTADHLRSLGFRVAVVTTGDGHRSMHVSW